MKQVWLGVGRALSVGLCALVWFALSGCNALNSGASGRSGAHPAPPGMVWVPAGEFTMGWDGPGGRPDERPAHRVWVDGFWMDATEVTNGQFATFVEATGYVTTAERPVDWEALQRQVPPGTPKPPDELLQPGSLVFTPPDHTVGLGDPSAWWRWVTGANWRHPEGPDSSIDGREQYPAVHVSWDDAAAYCEWAGKRLPTEAEWERAARFGHDEARYAWGDNLTGEADGHERTRHLANIWQGEFPDRDTGADGFAGLAPVGEFPPNELGLFDMAGNVWEWVADAYAPDAYARRMAAMDDGERIDSPREEGTGDGSLQAAGSALRVQKGGSFLCHESYCESYRPSARMGVTPDTGLSHVGFRCAMDRKPGKSRP